MEVTILEGCETATDSNGKVYEIEGIELTRQGTGVKVFYDKESSFYKMATYKNIKSPAYLMKSGKVMLT